MLMRRMIMRRLRYVRCSFCRTLRGFQMLFLVMSEPLSCIEVVDVSGLVQARQFSHEGNHWPYLFRVVRSSPGWHPRHPDAVFGNPEQF